MIFLVDGDNNIGTGLKGIDMLSREDAVLVFYQKSGLALSKIQKPIHETRVIRCMDLKDFIAFLHTLISLLRNRRISYQPGINACWQF